MLPILTILFLISRSPVLPEGHCSPISPSSGRASALNFFRHRWTGWKATSIHFCSEILFSSIVLVSSLMLLWGQIHRDKAKADWCFSESRWWCHVKTSKRLPSEVAIVGLGVDKTERIHKRLSNMVKHEHKRPHNWNTSAFSVSVKVFNCLRKRSLRSTPSPARWPMEKCVSKPRPSFRTHSSR